MIQISPKAFLFDFDGVICNTEQLHMRATQDVVKAHELHFTEHYYFENLFGYDDKELFKHLFEINNKTLTTDIMNELMIKKNQIFMKLIQTPKLFFDGVTDLITSLSEQNILLGIVSGALSDEVNTCLEMGNIAQYFQFSVCADDVTHTKPHPESYELAFDKIQKINPEIKKADCWVLEDSPLGITAAKSASLNVIAITNTTNAENLKEANHIISNYQEITLTTND